MEDYLNLYLLTFNCARNPIPVDLFAKHLFHALPSSVSDGGAEEAFGAPELIILCLQEIAPIASAFLGGSSLAPYFDAFIQAVDRAVSKRWDINYVNLVRENSGMTGLMVFVRSDIVGRISWIDTAHVGVGFQDMGNKGAVGARLGYLAKENSGQDTVDLTFVAAHLAQMEYSVKRRNEDWREIVKRLVFSRQGLSTEAAGGESDESVSLMRGSTTPLGMFAPTAYLFFAGDLNYRTSDTLPNKDDYTRFPRPTTDVTSLLHYSQLLKDDQLVREKRRQRCLHGLTEAPIKFAPTYKYSVASRREVGRGSGDESTEWKWARYRWPSWTDRILYLDTPPWMPELGHVKAHVYDALPLFPTSDHRAVALSVSVPSRAIRVPEGIDDTTDVRLSPPFPLDPDWKYKQEAARNKEIIVGYLAYLGLTWQGGGIVLAAVISGLGVWFVLRTLLE